MNKKCYCCTRDIVLQYKKIIGTDIIKNTGILNQDSSLSVKKYTNACAKHHRKLSSIIRHMRIMGLIPIRSTMY